MKRRARSPTVALAALACLAGAGCHSLFGDFDVDEGASGAAGAGASGGAPSGGLGGSAGGGMAGHGAGGAGGTNACTTPASTPAELCQGRGCADTVNDECGQPVSCGPCNAWGKAAVNVEGGSSRAFGLGVDRAGNAIVTGECGGKLDFGGEALTCAPDQAPGLFIWKLDDDGARLWAKTYGDATAADKIGDAVATDASSNIFVGGIFAGGLDFGPLAGALFSSSATDFDAFVVKLDPGGAALWAKSFATAGRDFTQALAAHPANGGVAVLGGGPPLSFGCPSGVPGDARDISIAQLNANGDCEWAKVIRSDGEDTGLRLVYAADGGLLVTGVTGVGPTATAAEFGDKCGAVEGGFVAKLAPVDGRCEWVKRLGVGAIGNGVAVAGDGSVWVTGNYQSTVDLGGGPLPASAEAAAGARQAFVVKLDRNGNHLYSKGFGDSLDQSANHVAVDRDGNALVTGVYYGTLNVGGSPLTNPNPSDTPNNRYNTFLVKFDPTGRHIWSKGFGGPDTYLEASDLAVDGDGNVFFAGQGDPTFEFGNGPIAGNGAFVAKFGP